MSSDTFEEFFSVVKKNKSGDKTKEILDFMQNAVMQIAEIVDQLDLKVTSLEGSITEVKNELQAVKNRSTASPASPIGGGSVPAPPAPGGSGGLPPLPGMGSPPSGGGGSFGGLSPAPKSPSSPPADRPMSPMMMQANLQSELKAAFKNIRARLDEGDE